MKYLSIALISLATPVLQGCGFTPLYATEGPTGVASELVDVHLASLAAPSDAGRFFDRALRDDLPGVKGEGSRYQLAVRLKDRRQAIAVTRSADTTRFDYILTADYRLTDTTTGDVRRKRLNSTVSYGVVEEQYASLVGREDAVRRAAEDLAQKVEFDLALFLKGRSTEAEIVPLPDVVEDSLVPGGRAEDTRQPE